MVAMSAILLTVMSETLSLGEYIRRLRRAANRPLGSLADQTGISYTHLSRIENDSKTPSADSLVKIAAALGGNLELMLEKTNRLRTDSRHQVTAEPQVRARLRRSIPTSRHTPESGAKEDAVPLPASEEGPGSLEANDLAEFIDLIRRLNKRQRRLVRSVILTIRDEDDGSV